jgi:hypothetical protein
LLVLSYRGDALGLVVAKAQKRLRELGFEELGRYLVL